MAELLFAISLVVQSLPKPCKDTPGLSQIWDTNNIRYTGPTCQPPCPPRKYIQVILGRKKPISDVYLVARQRICILSENFQSQTLVTNINEQECSIYFHPGKNVNTLLGAPLALVAPNRGELLFQIRSRVVFAQEEIISYPATGLIHIFGKILRLQVRLWIP